MEEVREKEGEKIKGEPMLKAESKKEEEIPKEEPKEKEEPVASVWKLLMNSRIHREALVQALD